VGLVTKLKIEKAIRILPKNVAKTEPFRRRVAFVHQYSAQDFL